MDPHGSEVLVGAMIWMQSTLLGTVATTVAVIAVIRFFKCEPVNCDCSPNGVIGEYGE